MPLPFNNTDIFFVDYTNAVSEHTCLVRTSPNLDLATFDAQVGAILPLLSPFVNASTITRVRYQKKGTNFSTPVFSTLNSEIIGENQSDPNTNPLSLTFVGRDDGGVRGRFSWFSFRIPFSHYRLTVGEDSNMAALIAALNNATDVFYTIAGKKPVWYGYGDVNANDYWVRRARS